MLLAVGILAIVAVAAVTFAARNWTRIEFSRFQEHERARSPDAGGGRAARAAAVLEGRCCVADAMNRAGAELSADEVLVVVDEHGAFIAGGGPALAQLQPIQTHLREGALLIQQRREGGDHNVQLRVPELTARRISIADHQVASVYVVPVPRLNASAPAVLFLGSIDRGLVLAASVVAALALIFTWAITRRVVRPIGELSEAAHDVARGDLSRRVNAQGSDEVAALAQSFNTMASELERQHVLRRRLVQDVAHELRTPLTALQCRLETFLDGFATDPRQTLGDAVEEVRHLARLLDDLQELAVAEARELQLCFGDVPVAELARSAIRVAGLEGDSRLRVEVDSVLTVHADAMRARQVLINLLTNAGRHTPPDGEITLRAARAGREVELEVRNTGSSLANGELTRVFDRFYRGDPARPRATGGVGLGLAIVKHLVEAQGGQVSARSDGASVTIRFTLAACGMTSGL